MREIKFRVWDIRKHSFDTCASITLGGEVYNHFDGTIYGNDKFLISQYTGLKDKNGREIYDGDIVRFHGDCDDEYQESVVHDFNVIDGDFGDFDTWTLQFAKDNYFVFEVIGNIYENPELLTATKEG